MGAVKRALFDAVSCSTPAILNDYPIQNMLIALAGAGFVLLRSADLVAGGGVGAAGDLDRAFVGAVRRPVGTITGMFSDLFYSDPRRLSAVVTMLLMPMAGYALFCAALLVVAGAAGRTGGTPVAIRAAVLDRRDGGTAGRGDLRMTWHYFPRHRHLMGEKYDQVMVNDRC